MITKDEVRTMMASAGFDPDKPESRRALAERMELTDRSLLRYLSGEKPLQGPALVLLRHLAAGGRLNR